MVPEHTAVRNKNGFTLIELLLVIIIIGVLASMVTINVGEQLEARKYKNFAREIAADLRRAQQEAISREETIVVKFRGGPPHEYYTINVGTALGTEKLKTVSIPEGITITGFPSEYSFFSTGMSDNGTIRLENRDNDFYYVIIYQTGRVRLSEDATP